MKNKLVNKNVIRAISVGLAAVMASTPITAFADEPTEGESKGNTEQSENETAQTVTSEATTENKEVIEKLDAVKDDYSEAAAEIGETDTAESGKYAEVVGDIAEIESGIEKVNDANDAAATEKIAYEEELKEALDSIKEVDGLVNEIKTTDEEGNETTTTLENEVAEVVDATGDLLDAAKEAADKAESATTRGEVDQAAEDAQDAADAADAVSDELQAELEAVDEALVEADAQLDEAKKAYADAVAAQEEAEAALNALLKANGLVDENGNVSIYKLDENGEYVLDEDGNKQLKEDLSGDVADAIEAALDTLKSAQDDVGKATDAQEEANDTLNSTEVQLLQSIKDLETDINDGKVSSYWGDQGTQLMNQYLIKYKLLTEVEGLDYSSISFSTWTINHDKDAYYVNGNYVTVTYNVTTTDENGNTTTEKVTKDFNYHKANSNKTSASSGTKDIEVFESTETTTKVEVSAAYVENYLANGDTRLETDENGNYEITSKDENGETVATSVSGAVVDVATEEDANSKAVLGDKVSSEILENTSNVTYTVKEGTTNTSYEYTTVTVNDTYGTKLEKDTSEDIYLRTEALEYIGSTLTNATDKSVTVWFYKQGDWEVGKKYYYTYNSIEEFNERAESEISGLLEGVGGYYHITVNNVVTDYDNVITSHKEDAVMETVTAEVEKTETKSETSSVKYQGSLQQLKWVRGETKAQEAMNTRISVLESEGKTVDKEKSGVKGNGLTGYYYEIVYSETTTETKTVSTNVYKADIYTNKTTNHDAVYKDVTERTETLYTTQAGINYDKLTEAEKAKDAAEKAAEAAAAKNEKAQSLYDDLLKALENLRNLKAHADVSETELKEVQTKVTTLRTQYEEAKEAAKKAAQNAENAQAEADRAAEAAANFTEPTTGDTTDDTSDDDDDDTTADTTPTVVTINDGAAPLAAAPAAANVQIVNAAAGQNAVDIADEATPLADNAGTGTTEEQATGEQEQASITITDEETPLVSVVDEDQEKMSWWWLLIVAILGATGYEMYKKHQQKKAKEAEQRENIEQ